MKGPNSPSLTKALHKGVLKRKEEADRTWEIVCVHVTTRAMTSATITVIRAASDASMESVSIYLTQNVYKVVTSAIRCELSLVTVRGRDKTRTIVLENC